MNKESVYADIYVTCQMRLRVSYDRPYSTKLNMKDEMIKALNGMDSIIDIQDISDEERSETISIEDIDIIEMDEDR